MFFATSVGARAQIAAPVPVPDLTQPAVSPDQLSVGQRQSPDFSPEGIDLGPFTAHPSIELGESYDTNLYGSQSGTKPTTATQITPSINLSSNWSNHAFGLLANGTILEYARYPSDDQANVVVQADGRLDIQRGEYLEAGLGYQMLHEDRASPDSEAAAMAAGGGLFALSPTEFTVETGNVSYVYAPRRVGVAVDAVVTSYRFADEPTANGGVAIGSDQNRTEFEITPRLSYELLPGYQAFVQTSGDIRSYQSTDDRFGFRHGSSAYSVAVGTQFSTGGQINGTVYLGYEDRHYQDPRFADNKGIYFKADIVWNPTRLTSVTVSAKREVLETALVGSSGAWESGIEVKLEHELLRNLMLSANASYTLDEYQGITETDTQYQLGANARWAINPNVRLDLTGSWQTRSSNVQGLPFDRKIVTLSVGTGF